MFRTIPGSRLLVPTVPVAWALIVLGVVLIAVGTAGMIRVRSHMWGETRSMFEAMFNSTKGTLSYLLHEYDEPDKPLILLGLVGRFLGGVLVLWSLIALIWA
ncbi:MAG TPA: hypothetical protein PLH94_07560 [Fimbriimonadaceae bacterium]|nr:hypothetical protein [Fimbriimonadaceae bacterium]